MDLRAVGEADEVNAFGHAFDADLFSAFGHAVGNDLPHPVVHHIGELAVAIEREFGSLEAFRQQFQAGGATLFGSGWVWLAADAEGALQIVQEVNAGNPIGRGLKPILTFDVWEHAYYLDYQNRRPDHLAQLWHLLDWNELNRRYTE